MPSEARTGEPVRLVIVVFVFDMQRTERGGAAARRRGRQAHLGRLGFECRVGIGGEDAGKASEALVHGRGAPHERPWLHLRASVADENDGLGHLEEKRRAR